MDLLRLVTIPRSGRPAVELDLQDGVTLLLKRSTFNVTPPPKKQQQSTIPGRWGGSLAVSESHDNGRVGATWLVRGVSKDAAVASVDNLIVEVNDSARGRYLEWKPEGTTNSTLFEIRGPGEWKPVYEWAQFSQVGSMEVEISFPVAPLALGLPMDVYDDFAVNSLADYTFDAGAAADMPFGNLRLTATAGALNIEQRLIYTARGYQLADQQATILARAGTISSSTKAGAIPKRTGTTTYLECYVDDNGTSSSMKIDVVIGGVRTNRSTTAITTRILGADTFHVRGRVEGNIVTVEYFVAGLDLNPMTTPTHTASYTLAGAEITSLGAAVSGYGGVVFRPTSTTAADIRRIWVEPYSYRNLTLPQQIALGGSVPGTAPALADVVITPSGGSAAPISALIAWSQRPTGTTSPFRIQEGEGYLSATNGAIVANAGDRGGNSALNAGTTSPAIFNYSLYLYQIAQTDDFADGDIDMEVWAGGKIHDAVVGAKAVLSAYPVLAGTTSRRYSHEYGSSGKSLTDPSSGGLLRRPWRLGTITLSAPVSAAEWTMTVEMQWTTAAVNQIGIDYLILVPIRRRAASPTGKANDSTYPKFLSVTTAQTKRIASDGSGRIETHIGVPSTFFIASDHGLGGAPIELRPGTNDLIVKLSSLVPDDPTSNSTTEQLAHSATVHASVQPRYYLARG